MQGNKMTDGFALREIELGLRVALWQMAEDSGFSALDGLIAEKRFWETPPRKRMTAEDYSRLNTTGGEHEAVHDPACRAL